MVTLVVSLGLKYRYSNLSVAGHSPLASESTISTSPEYQTITGHVRLGWTSNPPPRHTLRSLNFSNIHADTRT
jgi:hypothetical protein